MDLPMKVKKKRFFKWIEGRHGWNQEGPGFKERNRGPLELRGG